MTDTMTESAAAAVDPAPRSDLNRMLMPELKELAHSLGISGVSGMRKPDLLAAIRNRQSEGRSQGSPHAGAERSEEAAAAPAAARPEAAQQPATDAPHEQAAPDQTTEAGAEGSSRPSGDEPEQRQDRNREPTERRQILEAAALEVARPLDVIVPLLYDGPYQHWDIGRVHFPVAGHRNKNVVIVRVGECECGSKSRADPAVDLVPQVSKGELFDDGARPVGRAVVDDQHIVVAFGRKAAERLAELLAFVVDEDTGENLR